MIVNRKFLDDISALPSRWRLRKQISVFGHFLSDEEKKILDEVADELQAVLDEHNRQKACELENYEFEF